MNPEKSYSGKIRAHKNDQKKIRRENTGSEKINPERVDSAETDPEVISQIKNTQQNLNQKRTNPARVSSKNLNQVKIKRATYSDVEKISEFLRIIFPKDDKNYYQSFINLDPFLLPERIFFIEEKGKILSILWSIPRLITMKNRVFIATGIANVGTHPDFRGRGYARKMLEHAISMDIKDGIQLAMLVTEIPEFYRKFGFKDTGRYYSIIDPYHPYNYPNKKHTEASQNPPGLLSTHNTTKVIKTHNKHEPFESPENKKEKAPYGIESENQTEFPPSSGCILDGFFKAEAKKSIKLNGPDIIIEKDFPTSEIADASRVFYSRYGLAVPLRTPGILNAIHIWNGYSSLFTAPGTKARWLKIKISNNEKIYAYAIPREQYFDILEAVWTEKTRVSSIIGVFHGLSQINQKPVRIFTHPSVLNELGFKLVKDRETTMLRIYDEKLTCLLSYNPKNTFLSKTSTKTKPPENIHNKFYLPTTDYF